MASSRRRRPSAGSLRRPLWAFREKVSRQLTPDLVECHELATSVLGSSGGKRRPLLWRWLLDRQVLNAQMPGERFLDQLGARAAAPHGGFVHGERGLFPQRDRDAPHRAHLRIPW